jgi:putative pyruvate formate lyase activating enzyme
MARPASYIYCTSEEWNKRIEALDAIASSCELCPRACKVNRLNGERGFCRAPGAMVISSIFPHHGEEPPISGTRGSGTVFFTYCTLQCAFCQNYQLSHLGEGAPCTPSMLAEKMVGLQNDGCHNINLVTATHFLPWIVRAIKEAAASGLEIPIVYNCGGYESARVLALLNGIVDIYLPDMKYGDDVPARRYSAAPGYVETNRAAIREMFRQVGPLRLDADGIAVRGLCIRHLVLPGGESGSGAILDYLKATYDPQDIFISLMAQYRPLYKACDYPNVNRILSFEEYDSLRQKFIDAGFEGFYQELERMDKKFVIDFKKRKTERLTGE